MLSGVLPLTVPEALLRRMVLPEMLLPSRPPAATPVLASSKAVTFMLEWTLSTSVVPSKVPASAPTFWLPSTEPPSMRRFSMRALSMLAKRPVLLLEGRLITRPSMALPRPWKRPRKALPTATEMSASLPMGLKPPVAEALASRSSASA